MYKCNKEVIVKDGLYSQIMIVRRGLLRYEVIQVNGNVIASGLRFGKYYNPNTTIVSGGICCYDNRIELMLENPKRPGKFDTVCVWR